MARDKEDPTIRADLKERFRDTNLISEVVEGEGWKASSGLGSPQTLRDLYQRSLNGILAREIRMTWGHAGSGKCFDFSVSKRLDPSVYQTTGHERVLAGA